MNVHYRALLPRQCEPAHLDAFTQLVADSSTVQRDDLARRVRSAARLAFAFSGTELIGTAALKRPDLSYRIRIEEASGVGLPDYTYPFELGWLYVKPSEQRRGHARNLLSEVLDGIISSNNSPVFATAPETSYVVGKLLRRYGLFASGSSYTSFRNPDVKIQLYI